jgi:rubrerythrin
VLEAQTWSALPCVTAGATRATRLARFELGPRVMARTIDFATLTLQDALDLGILIEQEAEERYEELAGLVGGRYSGDASDVFRGMVLNEAKHGRQIRDRRVALFGDAPMNVDRTMIWEVEAPDLGTPRVFMSPRQAMEVALDGEKKAYAFFAEALPHVRDPAVSKLFAELRDEELVHAGMLEGQMKHLTAGPDVEDDEADEPPAM